MKKELEELNKQNAESVARATDAEKRAKKAEEDK